MKCDRCKTPRPATSYCRDCGQFICDICSTVHKDWDAFAKHEVVALGQLESKVKQLDALKKVTLYCSLHQGKELEIYCETCGELICHNCTVSKHCRPQHKYDLVADTFERHKSDITASLDPVDKQMDMLIKALKQLAVQSQEINDQAAAVEDRICKQMEQFHKLIAERKAEMIGILQQMIKMKMKNIAAQKDELETALTRRSSCQSFVRDSLRRGSQGEVMKMKNTVTKQIKEMTTNFKADMLTPCEAANIKFLPSPELTQASQRLQFGKVTLQKTCPEKCFATGKGLEIAKAGERATAVLHVVDHYEKAYSTPTETVSCELGSEVTGEKIDCSVKKREANQYEISYQPTKRGRYQLHIKVEREHIKGSPFPVTVKLPVQKLGTPIKTISGMKCPCGVAVNKRSEVIVAESSGSCVSIFSPTGEKLRSFGVKGSGYGQFNGPRGVAVDDSDNILVVDKDNSRIQKFTSDGKFITAVGRKGNKPLEFDWPMGIAIHPLNKKVYVADRSNHHIQILNSDLTFSSSFGSYGSDNGQFLDPWNVTCDSTGNVYVVDFINHHIQVFTAEGEFLRKFGKCKGNGELNCPTSISIDSDDVVYVTEYGNDRVSVFTSQGEFLTSFGTKGSGPGQFSSPCGITVDKNGVVYVSDSGNNRLQLF